MGCVCVVREEGPVVTGLIYIPSKKKRKEKERKEQERKRHLHTYTDPDLTYTTHVRGRARMSNDAITRE